MAKALKCDRCGQFYDLLKGSRNYQVRNIEHFDKPVDLCPDCYDIFTKWLDGEKVQSDSVYGTGELYPGEFEEGEKIIKDLQKNQEPLPMGRFKTTHHCCNPKEETK